MPLCEMKTDKSAYSVSVSLEGYGPCSKFRWPETIWQSQALAGMPQHSLLEGRQGDLRAPLEC